MSKKINQGGYAFPGDSSHLLGSERGLTVRDYFAAKAMQGMLAAADRGGDNDIARYAYQMADAMLRVREAS